jgi:integrase
LKSGDAVLDPIRKDITTVPDKVKQGVTFKAASATWLYKGQHRKRGLFSPATVAGYTSVLNNLNPLLGEVPLAEINNGKVKTALETIAAKPTVSGKPISSKTIEHHFNVIKLAIASIVDREGDEVYPRKWNLDFIYENIAKNGPSQPSFTKAQVESIIRGAKGQYRPMYSLQAASGMRWSEVLAIKIGPQSEDHTTISSDCKTIFVRKRIYRGNEGSLKTSAAYRDVDLCSQIAEYLKRFISDRKDGFLFCTKSGRPLSQRNILRDSFHKILYGKEFKKGQVVVARRVEGVAPEMEGKKCASHAFRRYRTTHLRTANVPEDVLRFWIGHADKSVTDRYTKMAKQIEHRKNWADLAGIGFEIPQAC